MFWLPVEQYRRDGRVWRGVQRGASSISVSTARAVIELTNKAVGALQVSMFGSIQEMAEK